MKVKTPLIVIVITVLNGGLTSCGSVGYLHADALRDSCVEAAKLNMVKHSGACRLLEELSYSHYQQAVAEGHAWIAANGLDDQQIIKIRQGKVWLGMPKEAARLSWGDPFYIQMLTGEMEPQEQWIYARGKRLQMTNDQLAAVHYGFAETPVTPNSVDKGTLTLLSTSKP
jgi:hypothetical protein